MATRDTSGRLRVGMFEKIPSQLEPGVEYSPVRGTAKRALFTTGDPTPEGPTGRTFEARTVASPHSLDYAASEQGALPQRDVMDAMCFTAPAPRRGGKR